MAIEVPSNLYGLVKRFFVAPPGHTFFAADFAGIEALLVGWFAQTANPEGAREYVRLAKLGVHAFTTSHLVGEPADLSWPDEKLGPYLADIKRRFNAKNKLGNPNVYDPAKTTTHAANYLTTGMKMWMENKQLYTSPDHAQGYINAYYKLFPCVPDWHRQVLRQAEQQGWLRNPYGYKMRFYKVYDYRKVAGAWEKKIGEDAKRVIASLPQSTAAAIMKEAMRDIRREEPRLDAMMRLTIHDELLGLCRDDEVDWALPRLIHFMERERPELPLPAEWGMGKYLNVMAEGKVGKVWGEMR